MRSADRAALERVRRAVAEVRAGFASRPDALVDELRLAGEHRLAFMVRGLKLLPRPDSDYRDGLTRAREFLPEYDDLLNVGFPERTCYLRSVGCVFGNVDAVGYAEHISAIAETVIVSHDAGNCCRAYARLDLAARQRALGQYDYAEAYLRQAELDAGQREPATWTVTKERVRLELARGNHATASAALASIEARPLPGDWAESAERSSDLLVLRCALLRTEGDLEGAVHALDRAFAIRPLDAAATRETHALVDGLRAAGDTRTTLRLLERGTDVATRRGFARTEARLRLQSIAALLELGQATEAQAVAEPLEDAIGRLASDDLLADARAMREAVAHASGQH